MKDRVLGSFPVRVVKRYAAASGSTWAINIAWNTLFAFFPIVVAIILVVGLIGGGSHGISSAIDRNIASALPGSQGQLVVEALHSFRQAAGPLAIVSFVGLLWSGSSLFSAMDQGLDALYPTKQRGFISQKLMAVLMIVVFTVLVVVDVGSASLLPLITKSGGSLLSNGAVALALQVVLGVIDGVLLFGAIYLVVPNRPHKLRQIAPGAIAAAVLFEAFTLLFPLYFKLQHGFATYGSTFALFFLLMTFAFWIGQIIVLGGAVNAELHPPEPGAFPRAGSSISPDAQTQADQQARRQPAPAAAAVAQPAEQKTVAPPRQEERTVAPPRQEERTVAPPPQEERITAPQVKQKVRGDGWQPERLYTRR